MEIVKQYIVENIWNIQLNWFFFNSLGLERNNFQLILNMEISSKKSYPNWNIWNDWHNNGNPKTIRMQKFNNPPNWRLLIYFLLWMVKMQFLNWVFLQTKPEYWPKCVWLFPLAKSVRCTIQTKLHATIQKDSLIAINEVKGTNKSISFSFPAKTISRQIYDTYR